MASVIRVAGLRQASQAINRGLTFMMYNSSRRWTTDVKKEHGSHPVDEKLFFRKIPVEQKGVKYEMTVMDTGQTQPEYPVVLLIHGAPGGSIDFVNLIPFLLKEKLRIIAPNFPGFTGTDPSAVETALRSVAAAHFHKAKEYGAKIAAKKLPVLFALSKSDKIVECGRALDLLKNVMAAPNNCIVSYDENRKPSHHLQTEFEDWYVRTLVFQTGGHLVHKAHQDIVTDELTRLLRFIQHNH